jgi:hypothetical protein
LGRLCLSACDRTYDEEWLGTLCDRLRQWVVGGVVRQILLTGVEPQEWSAAVRDVVANCSAQDGKASLESVEDGSNCRRTLHVQFHLTRDTCEVAEMIGKHYADHDSV